MLIGYARVSTQDQNLDLQIEALTKAGCKKIFEDKISGSRAERPGLNKALEMLREGDTLVVWKLDRLGRSCCCWLNFDRMRWSSIDHYKFRINKKWNIGLLVKHKSA
jgi:DNA invertase Pin-like site-specific DNA recombinase